RTAAATTATATASTSSSAQSAGRNGNSDGQDADVRPSTVRKRNRSCALRSTASRRRKRYAVSTVWPDQLGRQRVLCDMRRVDPGRQDHRYGFSTCPAPCQREAPSDHGGRSSRGQLRLEG